VRGVVVRRSEEVAQTMYTHVSKCKHDKIKDREKSEERQFVFSYNLHNVLSMKISHNKIIFNQNIL
jgi:glutamate mutase epsilon subunit